MEKKKRIGYVLIICGAILLFVSKYMLSNNKINKISKNIGINSSNCKIESDKENHEGFLGDGEYFAKLSCNEQEINGIKINWKELPLSEELEKAMELEQCSSNECLDAFHRYNIPNNINGYYYFFDRHSDSKDKRNDKDVNNRSSYNFSVGIYDSDNKVLYYYELDT